MDGPNDSNSYKVTKSGTDGRRALGQPQGPPTQALNTRSVISWAPAGTRGRGLVAAGGQLPSQSLNWGNCWDETWVSRSRRLLRCLVLFQEVRRASFLAYKERTRYKIADNTHIHCTDIYQGAAVGCAPPGL